MTFFHRTRAICAIVALGMFSLLSAASGEERPRVDALRVAKLAADYLATHGGTAPYVTSIVLEPDALLGGKLSWVVRWSHPILADGNTEVGMRVKLDGSVSYIIQDKTGPKRRAVPLKS